MLPDKFKEKPKSVLIIMNALKVTNYQNWRWLEDVFLVLMGLNKGEAVYFNVPVITVTFN